LYILKVLCFFTESSEGKKIDTIKSNNLGAFIVVKPYSTIPSYFFDTIAACSTTQFFAPVFIKGTLDFVLDSNKKAEVLNALMKKLQKDSGHETSAYDKAMYTKIIVKEINFYKNYKIELQIWISRLQNR